MRAFVRQSLAGLRLLLVLTVLLGLLYPAAVWGVGRVLVPERAAGSLVRLDGHVVGSHLLGQAVEGDEWFHPRPSVAGDGYDAMASGGSNLGPESTALAATVRQRQVEVADREGVEVSQVPPDAVTASASGLDPHVSPAYAELQVPRVARERGLDPAEVRALVADATSGRSLGFLGEPAVNVVDLNVALAQRAGR